MGISFSQPYYLTLLLLLPYFIYLWLRSPKAFQGWQQKAFLGLRLLLVILVVLALAGLELTFRHQERTVVYVADLSASMAEKGREAAEWVSRSVGGLPPEAGAGVVSLGKKAMVEHPVTSRPDFLGFQAVVDPNHTDLAAGLRLARAMMPEERGKQIVLLTDGKQNRGDALEQAKLLRQQGVRLDVLPVTTGTGPEVLVKDLDIPSHLREGEYFDLKVTVESTVATQGSIRVMVDKKVLREEKIRISTGLNKLVWGVKGEAPGLHTYRVELAADQDSRTENNLGVGMTQVAGVPRILLVEGKAGDSEALGRALASTQMQVDTLGPDFMPKSLTDMAKYSSIVLVNVPATDLPDQAMAALESYVRDLGRGLVMVGGENSFGPGGYFKTPVEKALPVHMDLRGKGEIPSIGLALVVDKSGSMGGQNYGIPKMEMAKEAAIRAAEILEAKDQLGVIAFDDSYKWVVETGPLKDKEDAQDKIGSIQAGGGTNIYPGLYAAYQSLLKANVKVKHIILLTDGQSAFGGNYDELLAQMNANKITLSTVAVGSDSDRMLLSRLAEGGKGRYYFTDDFETIPKIFTKETIIATRSYLVQEPFKPVVTGNTSLLPANQGLPGLFGYVATSGKGTAETLLVSHKGDPILARWQYGLGRAVAWTSDAKGRWAGEWVNWSGFPQFWGKVISWTLPQEAGGDMVVSTSREGGEGRINVDLPGEREQVHDLLAKVVDPDGAAQEIVLPAVGPGQYQGSFPMGQPGEYLVQVVQRTEQGIGRQKTAGLVLSYSPEYRLQPEQNEFLAQLAAAGGGQVLATDTAAGQIGKLPVPAVWGKIPLWPKLLMLATVLLPVDIAARRFNWHLRWAAPLWQRFKGWVRKPGTREEQAQGTLVQALQQQKEAREQLYRSRAGYSEEGKSRGGLQYADFQNMVATGARRQEKAAAEQITKQKAAKQEEANNQTADKAAEEDAFTSRLLAAKRRAGKK